MAVMMISNLSPFDPPPPLATLRQTCSEIELRVDKLVFSAEIKIPVLHEAATIRKSSKSTSNKSTTHYFQLKVSITPLNYRRITPDILATSMETHTQRH